MSYDTFPPTTEEVFFGFAPETMSSPAGPGQPPANLVVVHPHVLLLPGLPQPDAAMIYRAVTEAPRHPHQLVLLSDLTWQLEGGQLWDDVADWASVTNAIAVLADTDRIPWVPIVLPEMELEMAVGGPETHHTMIGDAGTIELGPADRRQALSNIEAQIGLGWEGIDPGTRSLVGVPTEPQAMPYRPHKSR